MIMAYPVKRDGNFPGHSYLDGIPVKISEKFRPPRKITLPLSYQHHCPVELLNEEYDFSLEKNVLESNAMRKKTRDEVENARTEKLASTIEEFTRSGGEESSAETTTKNGNSEKSEVEAKAESSMSSSLLSSLEPNSILQPVPSTRNVSDKPDVTMTCKLNLEDFEAESSPFDSMALKTLNDMEELKSVLQNDMPSSFVTTGSSSWTHFSLNLQGEAVNYHQLKSSASDDSVPSTPLRNSHSTPDLLKEIGTSISAENEKKNLAGRPKSVLEQVKRDEVRVAPERDLHPEFQNLVDHITEMGFPRTQVVLAVQHFGTDDKKVIEHLCTVQTMVDLGYDPQDAGTALILHKHNENQTKEYLRLLVQFRDLGFDDPSIKNALQQFNNDRDKALDFLVS